MTTLDITHYGATNGWDSTAAIKSTINAAQPGDTVFIPAGTFLVSKDSNNNIYIPLKSDLTLLFADGAKLQALPTSANGYSILALFNVSNVSILGRGHIIGDRANHQGTTGEWGSGITVNPGRNINIAGVTCESTWGDGLLIMGGNNINVISSTFTNNRRNGISVSNASNLNISWSNFSNIGGTAPQIGIDFEVDMDSQSIQNVIVNKCSFANTGGPNISVGSPMGTYRNFSIENCVFDYKSQPISVTGNGGKLGTPWWAVVLKLLGFGWKFYPTSWIK
jgi:hypothetical protein